MSAVFLSDRARLVDLEDEREALRIRLAWANGMLARQDNVRTRRLRDIYAMEIIRVNREIQTIKAGVDRDSG